MDPLLAALVRGEISHLCQTIDGQFETLAARPSALLSGSFNPLHEGHRRLAEVASRRLRLPVEFELSIVNADKPELDSTELPRRLAQFVSVAPVWLTRAPSFVEKARLFPGSVFVVGVDTAERVVAARFYGNSAEAMDAALAKIRAAACRFLVAGRKCKDGRFIAADSLALPTEHRDLFQLLPEGEFRHDMSSSELRRQHEEPRTK